MRLIFLNLTKFLLDDLQKHKLVNFIFRLFLFILLILYGWHAIKVTHKGFGDPDIAFSFLHNVDLIFHEAGHMIFLSPVFGQFIHMLGGTIMQLLIPVTCMIVLLCKSRDPFGASVCFWWIGENFFDISVYMNDAERMWLPLLGGYHDWNYILTVTGLLQYVHVMATTVFVFGIVIMILSVLWGGLLLINNFKTIVRKN